MGRIWRQDEKLREGKLGTRGLKEPVEVGTMGEAWKRE